MAKRMARRNTAAGWLTALLGAGIVTAAAACSSSATGVDACKEIETARCKNAPACGISLTTPVSRDGREVDSCIRFYADACNHGLASKASPSSTDVNACVAAINNGSCDVVQSPEHAAACSFLIPVVTDTDSGADAGTDSGTDAADASDAADSSG